MRRVNLPGMTISAQDAIDQEMRNNELLEEQELDQDMNILDNPQSYSLPTPVDLDQEIQAEADDLLKQLPVENAIEEANEEVSNPYTDSKPQLSFQDKLKMLQDARRTGRVTSDVMSGAGMISDAVARGYGGQTAYDPKTYGKQFETRADKDLESFIKEQKDEAKQKSEERKQQLEKFFKLSELERKKNKDIQDAYFKEEKLEMDKIYKDAQIKNMESVKENRSIMNDYYKVLSGDRKAEIEAYKNAEHPLAQSLRNQINSDRAQKNLELIPEETTIDQMIKTGLIDKGAARKEAGREFQLGKAVLQEKSKMLNDKQIQAMNKEGNAFGQVKTLLDLAEQGNTVAFSAVGTKLARAMGEVGVLTDQDVVRYIQSGKLDQKAADTLNRWRLGKPSKATMGELNEITQFLTDIFEDKAKPIYINNYVRPTAENLNLPMSEAYRRMGVSPYTVTQDRKIDRFMKANDILDRQKAIDILIDAGKLNEVQ